ncbi:hypothetical protein JHK84_041137 [Glycine max]|uniref:Uncharacterized protein n=1 Tax=Glycine max TaxID=3847 RepID=A0A0R0GPV3_SOYBN|nr:hypothetical protein JHK86_040928 [Glycine max]KAG4966563.1 hypothetical protein JHK85_041538 [Glycine max]KAG5122797.1 hypothetical protein JHK84_041137 [Glycine max]KAH1095634.1 hypothetical protein GYH30_040771 [Glycine max]
MTKHTMLIEYIFVPTRNCRSVSIKAGTLIFHYVPTAANSAVTTTTTPLGDHNIYGDCHNHLVGDLLFHLQDRYEKTFIFITTTTSGAGTEQEVTAQPPPAAVAVTE